MLLEKCWRNSLNCYNNMGCLQASKTKLSLSKVLEMLGIMLVSSFMKEGAK